MSTPLRMVVPKGRIRNKIADLLGDANIALNNSDRSYRSALPGQDLEIKLMKPQNIPSLVHLGSHDIGFCGRDWIAETRADVAVLLDTGFDPVSIVAAAPPGFAPPADRPLVVASEYDTLVDRFIAERQVEAIKIRTFGATEVFPPEDADVIVDVTQTGETLRQNNLEIIGTIMESSTVLVANRKSLGDPNLLERIDALVTLLTSILNARKRVLLEMNVEAENLERLVAILPCMKAPTVQPLHGQEGYAVKVAVLRKDVPRLIRAVKDAGATDLLEYNLNKVIA